MEMETKFLDYCALTFSSLGTPYLDPTRLFQMEVKADPLTRQASLAVLVEGDFLEPLYSEGDVLLIRTQPSVKRGELGLFIVESIGYVMRFDSICLRPVNPAYPAVELRDICQCRGLVTGKLQDGGFVRFAESYFEAGACSNQKPAEESAD